MNMKILRTTIPTAITLCAMTLFTGAAPLDAMADTPPPDTTQQGHANFGMRSPFQRAIEQLNLTPEQSTAIHSLYDAERQQYAGRAHDSQADSAALLNPGDPNHSAAVQAAQARAAAEVQRRSTLEANVYNLLTPAQKAQLPGVLSAMQANMQHGKGHWGRHTQPPG
jgi:Spy/CpxP family protein refolding chaperone